jgi:hypothetical protein
MVEREGEREMVEREREREAYSVRSTATRNFSSILSVVSLVDRAGK